LGLHAESLGNFGANRVQTKGFLTTTKSVFTLQNWAKTGAEMEWRVMFREAEGDTNPYIKRGGDELWIGGGFRKKLEKLLRAG